MKISSRTTAATPPAAHRAKPLPGRRGPKPASASPTLQAGTGVHTLPPEIGQSFEAALGHRFGDVRVHADAEGARHAAVAGAAAVTVGRDIFFGAGRYRPDRLEGRRLLAHELIHVAQWQRGGRARFAAPIGTADRGALETEARTAGDRVLATGRACVGKSLPHASPLLHPVYISRHGNPGFLNLAFGLFRAWGYSPITRNVDSIQQIVGDLATRSGLGRVTIVSHAHPTNVNMALLGGGSPHLDKDDMAALTVPRTGVIGSGETPPASVTVPGILHTATPTDRDIPTFDALIARESDSTHLLPAAQLEALMHAIAADSRAAASLARIGDPADGILRQYVWWTLDGLVVPHGGFAPDRAGRLSAVTERARESYVGTVQVAAAVVPKAITDRDFEGLDREIARLTATWAWPVPADAAARAAAEQRVTSSPYAVVNAILWNPNFLPELAGADRRVRTMVRALPKIEDHYLNEATRNNVIQALGPSVLAPLGGSTDHLVRQWVWWVIEGAYPRVHGFQRATRTRIEAAAASRRDAFRDLIVEAIRAAGGTVPDAAAFDAAVAEVRRVFATIQFQGNVPGAKEQGRVAQQLAGSTQVTGVTGDPAFLRQLEQVRATVTGNTWFEIQGCRAGQDTAYLEAFRDFFANSRARPKVSAPSWFQFFGHYAWQTVSDAQVPGLWRQPHVQTAFAHWYPILTGNAAIPAPGARRPESARFAADADGNAADLPRQPPAQHAPDPLLSAGGCPARVARPARLSPDPVAGDPSGAVPVSELQRERPILRCRLAGRAAPGRRGPVPARPGLREPHQDGHLVKSPGQA